MPVDQKASRHFRKKHVVEAIQFTGENIWEVHTFIDGHPPNLGTGQGPERWEDYRHIARRDGIQIKTLEDGPNGEAKHVASPGDWIIKGIRGECWPCKPDIFAETYEPAYEAAKGEARPVAGGLTADFVNVFPDGTRDASSYEDVESALDRIDAPCRAASGKWLTLPERIAALEAATALSAPESMREAAGRSDFGLKALSADIECDRVLKVWYDHVVNDGDRKRLIDAINAYSLPVPAQAGEGCAKQCGTCRHWSDKADLTEMGGFDIRECHKPAWLWEAVKYDEATDYMTKKFLPEYVTQKVFVQDGSGYVAALYTTADFSCSEFEPAAPVSLKGE